MLPDKLLAYLLETAQDLLDTATYESQTYKADVLAHWLATLVASNAPELTPKRLALSDPETGEALEEITGTALLELTLLLPDGSPLSASCLLRRTP